MFSSYNIYQDLFESSTLMCIYSGHLLKGTRTRLVEVQCTLLFSFKDAQCVDRKVATLTKKNLASTNLLRAVRFVVMYFMRHVMGPETPTASFLIVLIEKTSMKLHSLTLII